MTAPALQGQALADFGTWNWSPAGEADSGETGNLSSSGLSDAGNTAFASAPRFTNSPGPTGLTAAQSAMAATNASSAPGMGAAANQPSSTLVSPGTVAPPSMIAPPATEPAALPNRLADNSSSQGAHSAVAIASPSPEAPTAFALSSRISLASTLTTYAPQSQGNGSLAPATRPGNAKQPPTLQAGNAKAGERSSANAPVADLPTGPASDSAQTGGKTASGQTESEEASFAAPPVPTEHANDTADHDASDSGNRGESSPWTATSNLAPSLGDANSPGATVADVSNNARIETSAHPVTAASQNTTADKKPAGAVPSGATPSEMPSPGLGSHNVAAVSGNETPATLTAPIASPAGFVAREAPASGVSEVASSSPQIHQMLDSAPPPSPATPAPPLTPDSAAAMQMNGQMHVGIRTDAFGAVEIHTVVQQSQVGITVHSDRDLTRWFSSEVPSLNSGLNEHHLNLTGVDFDNARSGIQTATGFQQGQQRQTFSQTQGSQSAASSGAVSPDADGDSEPATTSILPSELRTGLGGNRVSILV